MCLKFTCSLFKETLSNLTRSIKMKLAFVSLGLSFLKTLKGGKIYTQVSAVFVGKVKNWQNLKCPTIGE